MSGRTSQRERSDRSADERREARNDDRYGHDREPIDRYRDDRQEAGREYRDEDRYGRDQNFDRFPGRGDDSSQYGVSRPREGYGGYGDTGRDYEGDTARRGEPSLRRSGENYGSDWANGGQRGRSTPDHGRGGSFGGPQDPYSRGERDVGDEWSQGGAFRRGGFIGNDTRGMAGQEQRSGSGRSFSGVGPKGYERSDERLKEMICERITEDAEVDPSEVSLQVHKGEVTLEGQVQDRATKYRIEELIDACGGVKEIHNRLRIQDRYRSQGPEAASHDKVSEGMGQSGEKSGAQKRS